MRRSLRPKRLGDESAGGFDPAGKRTPRREKTTETGPGALIRRADTPRFLRQGRVWSSADVTKLHINSESYPALWGPATGNMILVLIRHRGIWIERHGNWLCKRVRRISETCDWKRDRGGVREDGNRIIYVLPRRRNVETHDSYTLAYTRVFVCVIVVNASN